MMPLTTCLALLTVTAPTAQVAVLDEPGFPVYGGLASLPPGHIVDLLRRCGLSAEGRTAAQLDGLTPAAYPALVLASGNTFPLPALAALRAYHQAGGILILSGVPFCHPTVKTGGQWRSQGHREYFRHDAQGLGTGGFLDAPGRLKVATPGFQPNPLALQPEDLPSGEQHLQGLDVASLPAEDEVLPLIEAIDPRGGPARPVTALIRHKCPEFNGAIDLWIGQVASRLEEADSLLASRLIVRGAAWCLKAKGLLTPEAAAQAFAASDKLGHPSPLPTHLAYTPQPRPWGQTYLPQCPPPARRWNVVATRGVPRDGMVALACLQALTSRTQPRLYFNCHAMAQAFLDFHVAQGYLDGYDVAADWRAPFKQFADAYKGAIVADPQLYRGELLALNVAACEDLILLTPELAKELGISVKIDLRGRFATFAEGLEWVWQTYGPRLSRHVCQIDIPGRLGVGSFAYNMAWRGPIFWPAGPVDGGYRGADIFREKQVVAHILSQMAPDAVMLGFPAGGDGIGLGEGGGVELASSYSLGLVASDFLVNAAILSGVRIDSLKQTPQAAPPPLARDKVYIALNLSDGDNLCVWWNLWKDRYFDRPRFGSFPLAFGMGPSIIDLMPGVAQWYYQHGGPNTEFFPDVSGIAYTQPENYGKAFADREAAWGTFLDWTKRYMARLDMHTIRTVGGGDDELKRYAAALPVQSLLGDMGRYSGREGIANLTYSLPDQTPVFRSVTSWRYGKGGFLREVREQVGKTRPAFVNGFVHCWTFDSQEAIAAIVDQRDADMVFVTPGQLAQLYREARGRGWAK
jgi:hypothetical protein